MIWDAYRRQNDKAGLSCQHLSTVLPKFPHQAFFATRLSDDVQLSSFCVKQEYAHPPKQNSTNGPPANEQLIVYLGSISYMSPALALMSGRLAIAVSDSKVRLLHNAILRSMTLNRIRILWTFQMCTGRDNRQWRWRRGLCQTERLSRFPQ